MHLEDMQYCIEPLENDCDIRDIMETSCKLAESTRLGRTYFRWDLANVPSSSASKMGI
jgi:hypothetical protein